SSALLAAAPLVAAARETAAQPRVSKVHDFQTAADVAKAEQEGEIVYYGHDGEAGIGTLLDAFKKDFPRIKTSYTRLQTGALYAKVTAEHAPKEWKDILKPAYRDGVSAKLSTSGMQHAQWFTLRKLYGNDFWQEFAKQRPKGFDSRAQLFDRLSKGDDRMCVLAEY